MLQPGRRAVKSRAYWKPVESGWACGAAADLLPRDRGRCSPVEAGARVEAQARGWRRPPRCIAYVYACSHAACVHVARLVQVAGERIRRVAAVSVADVRHTLALIAPA